MNLPVSQEVIALLRCPKTKQPLHLANPEEVEVWSALADGAAEGFLVTEDGNTAYPIEDGYPILLLERAIDRAAASS